MNVKYRQIIYIATNAHFSVEEAVHVTSTLIQNFLAYQSTANKLVLLTKNDVIMMRLTPV